MMCLTRITLVGALYLILISLIPEWMIAGIKLNHLPLLGRIFENLPYVGHERLGSEFLFWWNLAADRCRRGHGYGHSDRGAADHAALRWLHAEQRTDSRTADLVMRLETDCVV